MKPPYTDEYSRRMDDNFRNRSVTANGVDVAFRNLVAEVAKVELTSASALAFEGLTRVLQDRLEDPQFTAIVNADPEEYPLVVEFLSPRESTT